MRPRSGSRPTSKPDLAAPPAQPFKKSLVFKKALTLDQYEAVRVAHEMAVVQPLSMSTVNQPYQSPSYVPQPVIRVPQFSTVPNIQMPSYSLPTSIRMPQSSFSLPVTQYDPVDFPPMYYQGPGIPYANPHYIPPITNPATLYNPSTFNSPTFYNGATLYNPPTNFNSPTFNNPPTLYNPSTNFNSPTFNNPPTLYNPPTNFNSPTFNNPPTFYQPPTFYNPPTFFNPTFP